MKRLLCIILLLCPIFIQAQDKKDKVTFREYKSGYYEKSILKGIEVFDDTKTAPAAPRLMYKMDFSSMQLPTNIDEYKRIWANQPISQGNTGTCWCFSSTSYFESEIKRLSNKEVKLSEMFTVYWEYVEKVKRFIQERGNSLVDEGSEGNATPRIWRKYGIVPANAYTGMLEGQTFHNHTLLMEELSAYLKSVKSSNAWNEEEIIATTKSILNHYMGEPPTKVTVDGTTYSPQDYLKNYLKLNLDDYFDVISLMNKPYWTKIELTVEDNWWHSKDFYNVPLDDFMLIIHNAVRKGYGICPGGDVSEPGLDPAYQVAMVPSFDVPSAYIDENARYMRFANKTTTDDHGVHVLGYFEKDGKDWYLIKDSGAGSRNGGKDSKNFGYYFFHEDFIKLKMLDFCVHKDLFKEYLLKFK